MAELRSLPFFHSDPFGPPATPRRLPVVPAWPHGVEVFGPQRGSAESSEGASPGNITF